MSGRAGAPAAAPPAAPPVANKRCWALAACTFSAAAMPVPATAALPNSEWIQGNAHEVSGYGVENTSRQPVALAAMSWLPVARMAASTA